MTNHSPDHAERAAIVAAGLTEAQRLVFIADGGTKRTVNRLMNMGLVAGVTYHSDCAIIRKWSPLGLAVRASLHDDTVRGEGENGR